MKTSANVLWEPRLSEEAREDRDLARQRISTLETVLCPSLLAQVRATMDKTRPMAPAAVSASLPPGGNPLV